MRVIFALILALGLLLPYTLVDMPIADSPDISADLNSDRTVDVFDALQIAAAYGSSPNDMKWNAKADLNNDSIIDETDAAILCMDFGNAKTVQLEFQTFGAWWESGSPGYYVVQNQSSYEELRSRMMRVGPILSPNSELNFTESTLIAVFMGACGSTGYFIEIKEILDSYQFVVVKVEKTHCSFGGWMITYPFHVVKVDKIDKPIIFETTEIFR